MSDYLPRTIEQAISDATEFFKVVLLTGMRQVGKSTCLQHMDSQRNYVSLDSDEVVDMALSAPSSFFKQYPLPVTVDEIQRVPKLFLEVKATVDPQEKYGQVWLTGSQRFSLMRGVADSLAGRIIAFELMPLSIYERLGLGKEQHPYLPPKDLPQAHLPMKTTDETWQMIWQGAWPRVINADDKLRDWFYTGFIQTYLERDIRRETNVEKLSDYHKFMKALASRTGQELRIGSLATEVGVTELTIRRWLSVAEASGIIYLLKPYYANINKQLVKSPKIYFTDTGLACYLMNLTSPNMLKEYKDAGSIFETFVVTELLKSWVHNGKTPDFYFYRDSKTKEEIDLLIQEGNRYYPIEIKSSSAPTSAMCKNLDRLYANQDLHLAQGSVICMTPQPKYLRDQIIAHSIWAI